MSLCAISLTISVYHAAVGYIIIAYLIISYAVMYHFFSDLSVALISCCNASIDVKFVDLMSS